MSMIDHTQIEAIEKASLDELQALQLSRMKWSLQHAYDHVAHYRKRFEETGVHPEDLQTLADLGKFPLTAKQDLRENYPFDLFAVPMDEVVRIHASSGTTGKPTVVGYTKNDIDMWADVCAPISSMWRTVTACLPVDWVRIMVQNAWGQRSFPCRAARPSARYN